MSSNANQLFFPPNPVQFPIRKAKGSTDVEQTTLQAFIESKCPSLFTQFRSAWWLRGGHLQTVYSVVGDFSNVDQIVYNRTYLRLMDGGTIGLDFTPTDSETHLQEDTPVIVVAHGLTGGSHESYVRAILAPACSPVKDGGLGYRGVVVNFRGCARVPITSPQLYSAGHTDDLRTALIYLSKLYPKAPLLGVGFSLGANVLTRYVAEEGEHCRLMAACALACPWDLSKNNGALERSVVGRVYARGMGGNLMNVVRGHAAQLSKWPEHRVAQAVPIALALKSPTLGKWDDTFTRIAGGSSPPFPFPTGEAYYAWASSHKVLGGVRVPFLAINSADDPIVQVYPTDTDNGWVTLALTPGGGHLGWFEAEDGKVVRWVRKPVLEWLRAAGEDLVHDLPRGHTLVENDGFLSEEGRGDLGCKVVDVGDLEIEEQGEGGLIQGL